jgi:hypothetical protein
MNFFEKLDQVLSEVTGINLNPSEASWPGGEKKESTFKVKGVNPEKKKGIFADIPKTTPGKKKKKKKTAPTKKERQSKAQKHKADVATLKNAMKQFENYDWADEEVRSNFLALAASALEHIKNTGKTNPKGAVEGLETLGKLGAATLEDPEPSIGGILTKALNLLADSNKVILPRTQRDYLRKGLRAVQQKYTAAVEELPLDETEDEAIEDIGKALKRGDHKSAAKAYARLAAATEPKEPEEAESEPEAEVEPEEDPDEGAGDIEKPELGLADAEPEVEPASAPYAPHPDDSSEEAEEPEVEPDLKRHQYSAGEKNVAIVKKLGTAALVRVRGKNDKDEAVFKYLTVDQKALQDTVGDAELSKTNIWNYIIKHYKANPEEFREKFVGDSEQAYERFTKTSGVERPKDLNTYIRRYIGGTPRDMFINAIRRSKFSTELLPIASELNDDQVTRLLEAYPGLEAKQITPEHIRRFMTRMKRQFTPLEESFYYGDDIDQFVLLEVGLAKKFWSKLTGKDPEIEKYIQRAILYDALVYRMGVELDRDPSELAEKLHGVGVDVSRYPVLRGKSEAEAEPAAEPEAEAEPEGPEEFDPGDPGSTSGQRKFRVTPADLKESEILLHLQNDRVYSQLLRAAGRSPISKTLQSFKKLTMGKDAKSEVAELWAHLDPKSKEWMGRAVKTIVGRMQQQQRQRKLRSFKESYARATQDMSIEEARIKVQDTAHAALNMYVECCNRMRRPSVDHIYGEGQHLFEQLLEETKISYKEYQVLIKENQILIEFVPYRGNDLLEALINVIAHTADPLSEDGLKQIFADKRMLAESYRKASIQVESQRSFTPLSKIF